MPKKRSKWFEGNVFSMSSREFAKMRARYEIGVKKPTALETTTRKGKTYSRFYYKPVEPGELY